MYAKIKIRNKGIDKMNGIDRVEVEVEVEVESQSAKV
jgi:hypothetical protein